MSANLTDPTTALAKGIVFTAERFRDDRDSLREIANAMSLPISICRHDLSYRWVSDAYARWVGLPVEQVIGRPCAEVVGKEAMDAVRHHYERVLSGKYVEYEERILLKTLGWRWIHSVYAPTFGPDRIADGWVGMVLDIDEQRRAQENLRETEARFRKLADSVPVLVWMLDAEGRNIFVNARYVAFAGMSEGQIREQWDSLLHPEDRQKYVSDYRGAIAQRAESHSLVRLRRHDGLYRWFEVIGVPRFEGENFAGFTGCAFDVTERKISEDAAVEADRQKDEFLAVLGHELRNPLGALSNSVAVLEQLEKSNPTGLRMTEVARRQVGHLARLLDDLLDVGRVTAGKIGLVRRPIDFGETVAHAMRTLEASGETQFHRIEVATQTAWIEADTVRIEQVVNNLIENALKFTPKGGEIKVRMRTNNGRVTLTISDSGIGISKEFMPKVFQ
jgi:PAS domain S-box-containing protein